MTTSTREWWGGAQGVGRGSARRPEHLLIPIRPHLKIQKIILDLYPALGYYPTDGDYPDRGYTEVRRMRIRVGAPDRESNAAEVWGGGL